MNRRFGLGKYLGMWVLAVAMAYMDATATAYLREILAVEAGSDFSLLPYVAESADWHVAIETYRKALLLLISIICALQLSKISGYRLLSIATIVSAWMICYYAWLYLLLGWPRSLLSYDVLYFFPTYWIAPVACYLLLACTGAIAAGALLYLAQSRTSSSPSLPHWILIAAGAITCLYAFMGQSSDYAAGGAPPRFPWASFWAGYLLALLPALQLIYSLARKGRARFR